MAKDPTLFTSTGPVAATKPMPPRTSTIPLPGAAPPNETPQEKVARLRAAANRSKLGQETTFDRVVVRGRAVADWAHRFTTLSLIGFTAVATVVVAISLSDMIVHNRRKRNEWMIVQEELHRRQLAAANEALALGTANEDQMLLINRQRAKEDAEREKANKKGVFVRAKEALFSGMEKEEVKGGSRGRLTGGDRQETNTGNNVLKVVEDTVREGKVKLMKEKDDLNAGIIHSAAESTVVGGPLDQLAQKADSNIKNSTTSWTDWVLRR